MGGSWKCEPRTRGKYGHVASVVDYGTTPYFNTVQVLYDTVNTAEYTVLVDMYFWLVLQAVTHLDNVPGDY